MTPEQAAAYVNAQAAMMLAEIQILRAYDAQQSFSERMNPASAYQEIYDKYEYVLGQNAMLSLFGDVNRYAR